MEQYLINDLERLTGIKAHTIRIWEKRYALIQPSRTATNRRYYSADQLKKLMNVAMLLSHGSKISAVAELSNDELMERIEKMHTASDTDMVSAAFIHDLTIAMLTFDEAGFERVCAAASTRFGFYESMLNVFYPFLIKIGMLWTVDKTIPVQEHFAHCIIRRKIIAATDGLKPPTIADKKFLLFLPAEEWHETGLLFANYIIRSRGVDTLYLGQNVPFADLRKVIDIADPAYVLTFYISPKPKVEIEIELGEITRIKPGINVLVAGSGELLSEVDNIGKNIRYLQNVGSILEFI